MRVGIALCKERYIMADLAKGTTFVDGVSIANASNLNNLVDLGNILPSFISDKTNLVTPTSGCEMVLNDSGTLKKVTIANLSTVILGGVTGQVHGKTAVTALSSADEFLLWEDTVADERKITYANLLSEVQGDLSISTLLGFTILTGTATVNPSNMATGDNQVLTITVTGASTANTPAVFLGSSIVYPDGMFIQQPRVSAANTVSVNLRYEGGGNVDMASHTLRAVVFQY